MSNTRLSLSEGLPYRHLKHVHLKSASDLGGMGGVADLLEACLLKVADLLLPVCRPLPRHLPPARTRTDWSPTRCTEPLQPQVTNNRCLKAGLKLPSAGLHSGGSKTTNHAFFKICLFAVPRLCQHLPPSRSSSSFGLRTRAPALWAGASAGGEMIKLFSVKVHIGRLNSQCGALYDVPDLLCGLAP